MPATLLFHPRARTLDRFADGMLVRGEQARVAEHLAACVRCRSRVAFARDVAAAARQLAAPEPGNALLARVLADRAAGARTILPTTTPSLVRRRTARERVPHGVATVVATVAAVAGIVLAVRVVTHAVHAPLFGPSTGTTAAARGELRDPPGIFTSLTNREGLPTPSFPPARLEGGRLHPLRATYAISSMTESAVPGRPEGRSVTVRHAGRSVVDIAPAVVDGVEVWRVVRTLGVEGGGTPRSEAAHLARADLRLLDRTEHLWRYRQFGFVTLHQQLTGGGNDLAVRLSFEEGFGRRITRELPSEGRPYLTDALSPVLLMAVPLRLGWAGSVSMLRWGIEDDDVASRVALRVSGEESVTVPAGTFDCWRLTVVVDGRALVHWVRKSDGLAVKVSEPGREVVLTSAANH